MILTAVIVITLLPYLIIFNNGFSYENQDWSAFGNYLSGISALLNVLVFIVITILIHRIDSKNKKFELSFNKDKEILTRFLSAYEKLIENLYSLKTYLAKIKALNIDIDINVLLGSYESIKTPNTLARAYFSDKSISENIERFLNDNFYGLIRTCSQENIDIEMRDSQIQEITDAIETLIENMNQQITSQINNKKDE